MNCIFNDQGKLGNMAKSKSTTKRADGVKRKAPAKPARPRTTAAKIKRLDSDLVKLLQQRAGLILESARGGQTAVALPSANGDEESIRRLAGASRGPMPARSVGAVLREVVHGCRALVRAPRAAFPGPLFGNGHLAAMQHFGPGAECVPVDGAAAVLDEIHRKQSDFGLLPLDGSSDGRLSGVLDALAGNNIKICGIVVLRVRLALLSRHPRAEVREVYGTPAGLSRCRNWLSKHLSAARTIEVTSVATACQLAAERSGAATVAAREAGASFNLEIAAEDIEDVGGGARFAIVGGQSPPRTKNDRTALLIQLEQRSGALADALSALLQNKLNPAWIESFSTPGSDRLHSLFLELDGHWNAARLRRAATALKKTACRLEILGSYPAAVALE